MKGPIPDYAMTGGENGSGTDSFERKSRTQKKKEALSLQKLGERLLSLSSGQIEDMGLPQEMVEALAAAKNIRSRSARRRQLQHIGTLMRHIDAEPLMKALRDMQEGNRAKITAFKELETWRDELVSGNRDLLEQILKTCPGADRRHLTGLIRQAAAEREQGRPPRSYRALFRYLRSMMTD